MASKRKSTTPCMIPIKTLAVENSTEENSKDEGQEILPATDLLDSQADLLTNGHENLDGMSFFCKYCNYGSNETGPFVDHMNTKHCNFRDDPSYVCIACSFLVKDPKELETHNLDSHFGSSDLSWTVARHEDYTVVEQSVSPNHVQLPEVRADDYPEITITKRSVIKQKHKQESKKMISNHAGDNYERRSRGAHRNGSVSSVNNIVNSTILNGSIVGAVPMLQTQLVTINTPQSVIQPKLNTAIITPVLPKSSVQKNPSQQLPTAKSLPKVMIPLSSIPSYNSTMDSNSFLKNSFNKFPYPTKAELCYLTVVTKYPEEQIKIWFTAQRLKQGISWSPEEIEDSRKKMFNTVIQSIPQPVPQPTITVLNAPLVANANSVHHLIQAALPGQIVGQPQGAGGLLVTQPIVTNGIQGTTVPITVPSVTTDESGLDFDYQMTTSPGMPSPNSYDTSARSKKSRHQLGALKNSFCKSHYPSHSEVAKLTRITGLTTRDVRKWFSDKRYHFRNKPPSFEPSDQVADTNSDLMYTMVKDADADFALPISHTPTHHPRRQSWHQTPDFTVTRYKERAPQQIRALESSFAQNSEPSAEEVNRLRGETKMTRREIDGWFSEKRKKIAEELKKEQARHEDEEASAEEIEVSDVKSIDDCVSHTVENSPSMSERKVNPIKINLKALRVTESGDNIEVSKDDYTAPNNGGSRPSTPQKTRPPMKKTAKQRDSLKQMFVKTQWPSTEEYDKLVENTGLARSEIVRWFGDSRYSYKNGNLKWYDNYKKVFADNKPLYVKPLLDYFRKWQGLREDDLDNLCEKTGMSADEIRSWIAQKLEGDTQHPLDEGVDDPQSASGERPEEEAEEKLQDECLEPSENCEYWEPSSQEAVADQVSSQPSCVQPETIDLMSFQSWGFQLEPANQESSQPSDFQLETIDLMSSQPWGFQLETD
ncbi:zinc fingers and homeoboxes protein 3 isoform X2 [Hyla sarda]|uniref:zinc fingers and homeoboxes protein 3 isoform X2 n=1 Tax=Hyla sarda TaxID=327740 RepID=UPI0024C41014|nr:zinc fingers and homeoboxes protein 3 isoform X2 [Hyla sarda]